MTLDLSQYHLEIGDTRDLVLKLNNALDAVEAEVNAGLETVGENADNIAIVAALADDITDLATIAAQALQSANVAYSAAQSATDSTARIAAAIVSYALTDVKAILLGSEDGWELTGNQTYKNEEVPAGRYLGQYASAAAAWAQTDTSPASVAGDWFWRTAGTIGAYELVAPSTSTRIYRAGSKHLPKERAFVVHGASAPSLTIFDLTDPQAPMWKQYPCSSYTLWAGNSSSPSFVRVKLVWEDGALWATKDGGSGGRGLSIFDFKHDVAYYISNSAKRYCPGGLANGTDSRPYIDINATDILPNVFSNDVAANGSGRFAVATDAGVGVFTEDGSVLVSDSGLNYPGVEILNGQLYGFNTSSPNRLVRFGPLSELGASFGISDTVTNASTLALSSASITDIVAAKDSLLVLHDSGFDQIWYNPVDYTESLISRRSMYAATPPMKKPEVMLLCSTVEGTVLDAALVTGDNSTFTATTGSWVPRTAGALSVVSGKLRITNVNATNDYADLSVSGLLVGRRYKVSVDYTKVASTDGRMTISSGGSGTTVFSGSGTYLLSFVATATTATIRLNNLTGVIAEYHEYDNVTVVMQAEDLSGLNSHGNFNGTLTASAVATGGVAGVSGFTVNTNNVKGVNPWAGIADGDGWLSVAFISDPNSTVQRLLCLGYYSGSYIDHALFLRLTTAGLFGVFMHYDGSSSVSSESLSLFDDGNLHIGILRKHGPDFDLFADGEKIASFTPSGYDNLEFHASAEMFIGRDPSGSDVADSSKMWFCGGGQALLSDAEIKLMSMEMRNAILGRAALVGLPTTATYDEQTGTVELFGTTYRQQFKDGAIVSYEAHGVGSTPAVHAGKRHEVGYGGATSVKFSIPERNLREYQARKTTERFSVTYTGDSSRTTFPDPTDDDEMLVTRGARPVNVWDDASHLTEGASDDYTVDDYGLGAYVAEISVAPGANPVVIEFEREVWK